MKQRLRGLLVASGLSWLAGASCKDPGLDPLACQQTYGFGNYGCTDIAGTVIDSLNQPVPNASVTAGATTDVYDHVDITADTAGKFATRIYRRWAVPPDTDLDTVSTWIHAASAGAAPVSDSVFVQLRFYRLLHRPTTLVVNIQIGTP